MKHIAFPGLGIDFVIDPVALDFGMMKINWYGIIICVGIIVAFSCFYYRGRVNEGFSEDDVLNVTLLAVPFGVVGARLLYVLTSGESYDSFLDVIAVWNGGLAIYGGIIFGFLAVLLYSKIKKQSLFAYLDALAPALMVGQCIGRWGNFINGEAYGWSAGVEKLPWRMQLDSVYINGEYRPDIQFVHPTFFYESLWNLIGFAIIFSIYRKKKFDGQIVSMYLAWYGLGRGFIEMLRTDSLRVGGFKLMVILGFACFILGTVCLIVGMKRQKARKVVADSEINAYLAKVSVGEGESCEGKVDGGLAVENAADSLASDLTEKADKETAKETETVASEDLTAAAVQEKEEE